MKYKTIIFISVAVIIAAFILVRFVTTPQESSRTTSDPQAQNTQSIPIQSEATQTSEGNVAVKVTPKTLISGLQVVFEIIFDTHSVELNYDVMKIARLTDNMGNTYQPLSWTGGKGGHHIEGVLTFPSIVGSTKKVNLTISGIDNQDRVFSWNLN